MSAKVLDGKAVALSIRRELRAAVAGLTARGVFPCLHVILVGNDEASHRYVRNKVRVAQDLGIIARDHVLPGGTSQRQLAELIESLNADSSVHGILVQLPLPAQIDVSSVIRMIDPRKDVDGLHPFNLGNLFSGDLGIAPCTPAGILELLHREEIPIAGKEVVVVGRSNLVGKPVASLLLREHATVTVCHSKTTDLRAVCRRADILVVAVGRPRMITGDYIKNGAVVVDVGINMEGGCLVGDVDFLSVREIAGAITPVPGGVGPLTIAMLMKNTIAVASC